MSIDISDSVGREDYDIVRRAWHMARAQNLHWSVIEAFDTVLALVEDLPVTEAEHRKALDDIFDLEGKVEELKESNKQLTSENDRLQDEIDDLREELALANVGDDS